MQRRLTHSPRRLPFGRLTLFLGGLVLASGLAAAPPARVQKAELANRRFHLPAREDAAVAGGVSEKYLLRDETGQTWLFKPLPPDEAYLEEAAARLATRIGLETPEVFTVRVSSKITGSLSRMIETSGDLTGIAPSALSPEQLTELLKIEVFRWWIGDFDSHERNFLRSPEGRLVTIDHGRGFRRQDFFLYHLRGPKPRDPISYFRPLWEACTAGRIRPDFDAALAFIDGVMAVPSTEVEAILRPLAELRVAAQGFAQADHHRQVRYRTADEFLHAVERRRATLRRDFGMYYSRMVPGGYQPPPPSPDAQAFHAPPAPAAPTLLPIQVRDEERRLAPLNRIGRKAKMLWGNARRAGVSGLTDRWGQLAGDRLKRVGHKLKRIGYRGLSSRQVADLDLAHLPGGRRFLDRLRQTDPEVVEQLREKLEFLTGRADGSIEATNAARLAGWLEHIFP